MAVFEQFNSMALLLIIVGIYMTISGVTGNEQDVATLVHGDFTGNHSYIPWMLAILVIGAVGYVEELRPVSNAMLVLVVLALLLNKGNAGFFQQFFKDFGVQAKG